MTQDTTIKHDWPPESDTPKNWEKEFDEKFPRLELTARLGNELHIASGLQDAVKSFISKLLSQRTEEIKKIAEGMRKEDKAYLGKTIDEIRECLENKHYNQALSDLLQAINNLHKDE